MNKLWQRWSRLVMLALALWAGAPNLRAEANTLVWHWQQNRVDADITSWDLRLLLQHVATATGWRVYLDPSASHIVSAKFKNLPVGEALHSMLGDVNFIVIPQTNGASHLYVWRVSRQQATTLVAPIVKNAQPIPNELIVTLKPNSKTKIEDLARSLNAKIIGRMDSQNAYLLQFADDASTQLARQQLTANPDVAAIDNNYPIDAPPTPISSDNSLPNLTLNPKTNDGNCQLVVGLIDTSVQSLGTNLNSFLLPQINVVGGALPPADQLTHGTAMASTIIDSIAKTERSTSVKIQPVNVYGTGETTTSFDVANGIIQAVNNGANIINLSLGGTGDSQVLHNAIIQVTQQGIPIYAAAGNEPVTTPTYPAAYPEVISVTATDNTGHIASYANRGSFIDMTAPGDNVVGFNGLNYMVEGTSTSTAFATGAAAGLADASHVCADQAEALLKKTLPHSAILKAAP